MKPFKTSTLLRIKARLLDRLQTVNDALSAASCGNPVRHGIGCECQDGPYPFRPAGRDDVHIGAERPSGNLYDPSLSNEPAGFQFVAAPVPIKTLAVSELHEVAEHMANEWWASPEGRVGPLLEQAMLLAIEATTDVLEWELRGGITTVAARMVELRKVRTCAWQPLPAPPAEKGKP
jgi:hypothetical protein